MKIGINRKSMIALLLASFLLFPIITLTSVHAFSNEEEWKAAYTVGKFLFLDPPRPDQIFKIQYRVINGTVEGFNVVHILDRVSHPQTNGKLERFYGEVERKLHLFKSIDELIDWWNNVKPHMSLNFNNLETPSQAYIRKMPGEGIVIDEQSGEIYHAKKEE